MSNHNKNGIMAHNDRRTIANYSGNLHAMSAHTKNDTQGAHIDRYTITPPGVGIFLLSRY